MNAGGWYRLCKCVPDNGLARQGHGSESIRGEMRDVKDTATGSNGAAG